MILIWCIQNIPLATPEGLGAVYTKIIASRAINFEHSGNNPQSTNYHECSTTSCLSYPPVCLSPSIYQSMYNPSIHLCWRTLVAIITEPERCLYAGPVVLTTSGAPSSGKVDIMAWFPIYTRACYSIWLGDRSLFYKSPIFIVENGYVLCAYFFVQMPVWYNLFLKRPPGGRLNIKMLSSQYRNHHVKEDGLATVLSLTWESPYLGKTVFVLRRGPVPAVYETGTRVTVVREIGLFTQHT